MVRIKTVKRVGINQVKQMMMNITTHLGKKLK
jgi:hypothetical protein